ncbi:MAG: hypothetical protein WA419_19645 [Silvibacterium sp.]
MRLTPVPSIALLAVVPAVSCFASGHDFDAVVSAVEHRYQIHAQHVPMMGFASFCAHVATNGGVKGLRIAEFDHVANIASTEQLSQLVSASLSDEWQRFITDREGSDKLSVIFVQPDGDGMRMLIADMDHGELDVVRMELNGEQLAKWVREPQVEVHRRGYGAQ